jgi:hypothetical protein
MLVSVLEADIFLSSMCWNSNHKTIASWLRKLGRFWALRPSEKIRAPKTDEILWKGWSRCRIVDLRLAETSNGSGRWMILIARWEAVYRMCVCAEALCATRTECHTGKTWQEDRNNRLTCSVVVVGYRAYTSILNDNWHFSKDKYYNNSSHVTKTFHLTTPPPRHTNKEACLFFVFFDDLGRTARTLLLRWNESL